MRAEALAGPLAEGCGSSAGNPQKSVRKSAEGLRKGNPPRTPRARVHAYGRTPARSKLHAKGPKS